MSQRVFAVTSADSGQGRVWCPSTRALDQEDLSALRELFNEIYPNRSIVEISDQTMGNYHIPIAIFVEVEISDLNTMTDARAQDYLTVFLTALRTRIPQVQAAELEDEGYRASYMWDGVTKNFRLHIVFPNTFYVTSRLYALIRDLQFSSRPFNRAYKSIYLQDRILNHTRCIPLYLGEQYKVIRTNSPLGYTITTTPPPPLAVTKSSFVISSNIGGEWGRLFNGQSYWHVPVPERMHYFIKMIREQTHDYDNICTDVVYTVCKRLDVKDIREKFGLNPRIGMKERSERFLLWIAKRVVPERYNQWILEQCSLVAQQFSKSAVTDEIFQDLFALKLEGDYISISESRDPGSTPTLYYFDNTWIRDTGFSKLGSDISKLVMTFIGEEMRIYMEANQADDYKVFLAEAVRLNYATRMRDTTVRSLAKKFIEKVKFDEDPNLLGCRNVVIEMDSEKSRARPGRPEDLISKSTNLLYQEHSEEDCLQVKTLFRKLFGDEELRNWFFRLMCSLIYGGNPERSFYILFGCARNGKSGVLNLLEAVMGDYFGRFSSKAFNERSDPSATSPELAAMHGKRTMVTSELKAGAQMEADILKALTGDDGVPVRGLYQEPGVLRMMAKIIIASNHFPAFLNADKALRDRTVLIPMEALFDDNNAPKTEYDQYRLSHFPADKHYRVTLERLAPIMLYMMVKGYEDYKKIKLAPLPEKVKDLTRGYWHEVGVQSRFIEDCIEFVDEEVQEEGEGILPGPPTKAERPKLTYNAGYERFSAWAVSRQLELTKYPRFVFKSLMDSELASNREHIVKFAVDGWIGCRLKV